MTTYRSKEELEEAIRRDGGISIEQLEQLSRAMQERIQANEQILRLTNRYKVAWGVTRTVGDWTIEPFEVTEEEAFRFNLYQMNESFGRCIAPGKYTRLVQRLDAIPQGDEDLVGLEYGRDRAKPYRVWMSDTQAEVTEHLEAIGTTKILGGHCLVTGLGIGMVANAMLIEGADTVTVLEIDQDIIDLVAPLLYDRWGTARVCVWKADVLTDTSIPGGNEWTVVWHDIWPTIKPENLREMRQLMTMYAPHAEWQGCWNMDICEKMERIDRIEAMSETFYKLLPHARAIAEKKRGSA